MRQNEKQKKRCLGLFVAMDSLTDGKPSDTLYFVSLSHTYKRRVAGMDKLSERIRIVRKERKESGETAAKRLGKQQTTWSAWELNKSEPDADAIVAICKEYGVSSDWLLGITDNRVTVTNGDGSAVNFGDNAQVSAGSADMRRIEFLEAQLRAANEEKARLLTVIESLTSK